MNCEDNVSIWINAVLVSMLC